MRTTSFLVFLALGAGAVRAAVPALGLYNISAAGDATLLVRHCDYELFATPNEGPSDDFHWIFLNALNGASDGVSLQSVNFPDHYLTIVDGTDSFAESGRLGIAVNPDVNNASFRVVPGLSDPSLVSLQSLSTLPQFAGKYVTLSSSLSGGCASNYAAPAGDVYLDDGADSEASTWSLHYSPPPPPPNVTVFANEVTHTVNKLFVGCHSDSGYTHQPRGFYSQLIFGESFEEPWNNVTLGTVTATQALDPSVPFNTKPSLSITVQSGPGAAGVSNRGLGNEGLVFEGGQPYEGFLFVQATAPVKLTAMLRDYTTGMVLDAFTFAVPASSSWQQVNFTLTPSASTNCVGITPGSDPAIDCGNFGPGIGHVCVRCAGEFAVFVNGPSTVHIGYVFLQPGEWGRFQGLPVLLSAVQVLQTMGINVIRQGGTFAQTIVWKDWRGPPTQRPSMQLTWGASLISGWGPFEMIDLCNAAGIEIIITLSENQSPEDWADLVEYCWGNSSTTWGAQRAADGHPDPYRVTIFELGNEQYNDAFVDQMQAMETRAASLGMAGMLRYMFPTNEGLNAADAARAQALNLPIQNIMPDIHIGGGGAIPVAEADFAALPNFPQSAINCETNAGIHTHARAMMEAVDLLAWFNAAPPLSDRLVARTASFCNERSGHYDNFDQGISFFLPNMTWIQPPGYVHAMISQTWADQGLNVTGTENTDVISVAAQKTADGSELVVRVVNNQGFSTSLTLNVIGAHLNPQATVWTLANSDPSAANSPAFPTAVAPSKTTQTIVNGGTVTLQPYSFTVIVFPLLGA